MGYTFIMKKKIKKILVLTIGIIFIILGILGLFLPFLQGILFLIIGLILVSFCFPRMRPHIKRHAERQKHVSSAVNKIEEWIAKTIGEI